MEEEKVNLKYTNFKPVITEFPGESYDQITHIISFNDSIAISINRTSEVKIWDLKNNFKCKSTFKAHNGRPNNLNKFTGEDLENPAYFTSSLGANELKLWLGTKNIIKFEYKYYGLYIFPSLEIMFKTENNVLQIMEINEEPEKFLMTHSNTQRNILNFIVIDDENFLIAILYDNKEIKIFDGKKGKCLKTIYENNSLKQTQIADYMEIHKAQLGKIILLIDSTIELIDFMEEKVLLKIDVFKYNIRSLLFIEEKNYLICGTNGGDCRLKAFDLNDGKLVWENNSKADKDIGFWLLEKLPGGKFLSMHNDIYGQNHPNAVRIWDMDNEFNCINYNNGNISPPVAFCLLDNGNYLASLSYLKIHYVEYKE